MGTKKRNPDIGLDDLASEFDYASEAEKKKKKQSDFLAKEYPGAAEKLKREDAKKWFQDEHGRMHRQMSRVMALNAYDRHKEMINLYYLCYEGASKRFEHDESKDVTDYDVLKKNHKFLWDEEDLSKAGDTYATRLAKKYYDKLFKEYCICDLSQYKKNRVAMRWRTEPEVRSGKGHLTCGARKCDTREGLVSWEVNFSYQEHGEKKNALVKVRLCEPCTLMLNYGSEKKRAVKKPTRWSRKEQKKKKRKGGHGDSDDDAKESDVASSSLEPSKSQKDEPAKNLSTDVWKLPVQEKRSVEDDIDDFLNELFD